MKYLYDDGGRKDAKYKGAANDCVCRAICILTGRDYQTTYEELALVNDLVYGSKGWKMGVEVDSNAFKLYSKMIGLTPHKGHKMTFRDAYKEFGDCILEIKEHWTAVKNGVLRDTADWSTERNGKPRRVQRIWKYERTT